MIVFMGLLLLEMIKGIVGIWLCIGGLILMILLLWEANKNDRDQTENEEVGVKNDYKRGCKESNCSVVKSAIYYRNKSNCD